MRTTVVAHRRYSNGVARTASGLVFITLISAILFGRFSSTAAADPLTMHSDRTIVEQQLDGWLRSLRGGSWQGEMTTSVLYNGMGDYVYTGGGWLSSDKRTTRECRNCCSQTVGVKLAISIDQRGTGIAMWSVLGNGSSYTRDNSNQFGHGTVSCVPPDVENSWKDSLSLESFVYTDGPNNLGFLRFKYVTVEGPASGKTGYMNITPTNYWQYIRVESTLGVIMLHQE